GAGVFAHSPSAPLEEKGDGDEWELGEEVTRMDELTRRERRRCRRRYDSRRRRRRCLRQQRND
ncbi:MAG TPA: hypothetical protein VGV91_05060, partial [Rubrobacter sp.]|nr:hypothetical protein [Rubrobacter sp.]